MSSLTIITHPDPILRKKSVKIIEKEIINNNEFKKFCSDMAVTMREKDGIGLAAPQIGKNIRLIVINTKNNVLCMVNPKITKKSWRKEWNEEGCLSVPGVYGKVKRHKKLTCVYLDKNGKKRKIQALGLLAFVIQHEVDHLDGILFIDKAKDVKKVNLV